MDKIKFIFALIILGFTLTGCEFLGDIFKAGIWVGIIAVVIVIALVAWLIRKFKG
jgi:hypothetical protein